MHRLTLRLKTTLAEVRVPAGHDPLSRREARTRRFRRLARTGYAVNGLIHFLIGGIAIGLAFGVASADEADQSGVLRQLASTPGGLVLIWAGIVGLVALGLWQVTRLGRISTPNPWKRWGKRLSEAVKGIVYLGLACTALAVALGGRTSSSETIQRVSAWLLETEGGALLLAAVGLSVLGTGVGFVVIGIRRTFRKLIRVPSGGAGWIMVRLGLAGYVAKGISLALVGALFVLAALTSDAARASGLDGALRALGDLPYGPVFLVVIGLGLVQYGAFLIGRAKLALL
jgi:hypothetical protein